MDDLERDELLSAYVDSELTAGERAQVEQLLAESVEARQIVAELRSLRSTFRQLPQHRLEADFPKKVLRQAERAMLIAPIVAPADHVVASGREAPAAEKSVVAPPVHGDKLPLELSRWRKVAAGLGALAAIAAAVLVMASLTSSRGDREVAQSAARADLVPNEEMGADSAVPGLQSGQSAQLGHFHDSEVPDRMSGMSRSDADAFGGSARNLTEMEGLGESQSGASPSLSPSNAGGMAGRPSGAAAQAGRFLKLNSWDLHSPDVTLYSDFTAAENMDSDPVSLSFAEGTATPTADQIVLVKLKRSELDYGVSHLEQLLASHNITPSAFDEIQKDGSAREEKVRGVESPQPQLDSVESDAAIKPTDKPDAAPEKGNESAYSLGDGSQDEVFYWVEAGPEQIQATLNGLTAGDDQFLSVSVLKPNNLPPQPSQDGQSYRFKPQRGGQAPADLRRLGSVRGMSREQVTEGAGNALGIERLETAEPQGKARYYVQDDLKNRAAGNKRSFAGGQLKDAVKEEADDRLKLHQRLRDSNQTAQQADEKKTTETPTSEASGYERTRRNSTAAPDAPNGSMPTERELGARPSLAAPARAAEDTPSPKQLSATESDNTQGQSLRGAAEEPAAAQSRLADEAMAGALERRGKAEARRRPAGNGRVLIVLQVVKDAKEADNGTPSEPAPIAESPSEPAEQAGDKK